MSSFVIDKKEYIKAAGIVAGLKSVSRDFWLYDPIVGRNMDEIDIHLKFCYMYELNSMSVLEQYEGEAPGSPVNDSCPYRDLFKVCRDLAIQGYHQGKTKELLMELRQFFHSALYQTENRAAAAEMSDFFYKIIDQILPIAFYRDCKSWGVMDISGIIDEKEKVYDIFELCGM